MKEQTQKAAEEYAERSENILEYSDNWQEYTDYEYVEKAFIAGAEYGYKFAVEKACDVINVILEDFLHGGDSDIVIALFEEKMEEEE